MIHGRILITDPGHAAANEEILQAAEMIALREHTTEVKLELVYPREAAEGSWDQSGDAVRVTFSDDAEPLIETLPPYSEETP